MEDEQIVDLLFSRSEAGLEETAGKYGRLLLSITSGILCNDGDAEECVNDTYLKIWNIIPPYRPTHFRSFLCKITRQLALDRYRTAHSKKANAEKVISLDELASDFPDESVENFEINELSTAIDEFLDKLDTESRVLFTRRYFLAESQNSIAERFEMTENLVGVKLFRIRKRLKKHLEERGYRIDNGKN